MNSAPTRLPSPSQAPRVLCVGHALKETLSVGDSRRSLEAGVDEGGGVAAGSLSISDGGDGFLDAWADVCPVTRLESPCTDPLGRPMTAPWLFDETSRTAVIESARICGLALLRPGERSVMDSTTAGLGDILAEAMGRGARRVMIGLGGSATTDGGAGMLVRLGERLLGRPSVPPVSPRSIVGLADFPFRDLRQALAGVEMVACTDVTNPLLGPEGSAAVFGPQKGASPEEVRELDRLLTFWAERVEAGLGPSLRHLPGAGAAGGLGFAFLALGAVLRPGVEVFFELSRFEQRLGSCDVVITSEGRFDGTSLRGKAPWQVAERARAAGRKAAIVCGSADPVAVEAARSRGVDIVPFVETVLPDQRAREAARLVRLTTARYIAGLAGRRA